MTCIQESGSRGVKEWSEFINDFTEAKAITELCAGKENALFLTDSGQVFVSAYITSEIKDAEYYNMSDATMDGTAVMSADGNVHLKSLFFEELRYENIVHINTDGEYHFSLIDEKGNCFDLDMSGE